MSEDGNNYVGKAKQFYDKYQRNGGGAGLSKKIKSKQFC